MGSDDTLSILMRCFDAGNKEERDTYVRAPFGWPGGKDLSRQQILEELPYRNTWIEHCGGSGIITLNRRKSKKIDVFNDRHSGVTAFFRCFQNREIYNQLYTRLQYMIHSREEFVWCKATWRNCEDTVERAARWYYMVRMSFSQLGRNFGRSTRSLSQHPFMIRNSLEHFPRIFERMGECQIENMDLFQCIADYDDAGAVHYIDPNYVDVAAGIYEHEIKRADHYRLCDTIMHGKGFFALSGYANPIYDDPQYTWTRRLVWKVPCTAQSQAVHETNHRTEKLQRDYVEEVLWIKDHAA